jgi:hypothetical protein
MYYKVTTMQEHFAVDVWSYSQMGDRGHTANNFSFMERLNLV